jgi:hypothetical protein
MTPNGLQLSGEGSGAERVGSPRMLGVRAFTLPAQFQTPTADYAAR